MPPVQRSGCQVKAALGAAGKPGGQEGKCQVKVAHIVLP